RTRILFVSLATFSTFMLITAGTELFMIGLCALAVYVLCALLNPPAGRESTRTKIFAWQFAAMAAGVLMAMPAICPALEWKDVSRRQLGLPIDEVLSWSANWYDVLCLILPQPLGDLLL